MMGFPRSKVHAILEKNPNFTLEQVTDQLLLEHDEDSNRIPMEEQVDAIRDRQLRHVTRVKSKGSEVPFPITDSLLGKLNVLG